MASPSVSNESYHGESIDEHGGRPVDGRMTVANSSATNLLTKNNPARLHQQLLIQAPQKTVDINQVGSQLRHSFLENFRMNSFLQPEVELLDKVLELSGLSHQFLLEANIQKEVPRGTNRQEVECTGQLVWG